MNREIALNLLREAEGVLRERYSVVGASLFGSLARGDNDPSSDVDVVVRFGSESSSFLRISGVSGLLSGVFDTDVDVVAEPVRNPELALAIERDALVAF